MGNKSVKTSGVEMVPYLIALINKDEEQVESRHDWSRHCDVLF